jgi:hypothetical protein
MRAPAVLVDPTARSGRFSRRLVFYDEPVMAERLERFALREATSSGALVRTAVRRFLAEAEERNQP